MKTNKFTPENVCALVWLPDGLAYATFAERDLEGLPRVDIKIFRDPAEIRLPQQMVCLTAPVTFNFQTRRLVLDDPTLELNDAEVATYLIQAQQTGFVLGDGQPLMDTSLEETVAQMTRLPNERVSLTQLPRTDVEAVQNPTRELFLNGLDGEKREREEARLDPTQIKSETPLRAAARLFLSEVNGAGNPNQATVFVLANEFGFAVGLWNVEWGLFFERSESLPAEYISDDAADNSYLVDFLRHALDTAVQTAHEVAQEMGFFGLERVLISVPTSLITTVQPLATEIAEMEEIPVEIASESLEHQIARGLLYAYKDKNPLSQTDLSRDLYTRLIDNSLEVERIKRANQAKARANAAYAILLPFVLLAAFIVGAVGHYARQSAMLSVRLSNAKAEESRLKPVLEARNTYIGHFKWRESFLRQILSLRDRQTIAISFLPEVDSKTVLANDGRFAFSELKMDVKGAWSMKGVAASEASVTNFIRGLEYATDSKDAVLFTGLAPELKLGTTENIAGSAIYKSSINAPPGLVAWEIKGNYVPLASMAPRPASPTPPTPANPQQPPNGNQPPTGSQPIPPNANTAPIQK